MYGLMIQVFLFNILTIVNNFWTKLSSFGDDVPPELENPAAVLVESGSSQLIYVFGGRYKSRYGYVGSRTLYSYNLSINSFSNCRKWSLELSCKSPLFNLGSHNDIS
jgi:hypothetical protein